MLGKEPLSDTTVSVTVQFLFVSLFGCGHHNIIKELDISPDHNPTIVFQSGEFYLMKFDKNYCEDL